MSIQVTPIPSTIELTTPAFSLGESNIAGSLTGAVAADSTLLAFDTTLPGALTLGQSGAAGSVNLASHRDHAHAVFSNPAGLVLIQTQVASASATLTVTGLDTTYDSYLILINVNPTHNGYDLMFRVGTAGGIDAGATDYQFICQTLKTSTTSYTGEVGGGNSSIVISDTGQGGAGADTGEGFTAALWLFPGYGVVNPLVSGHYSYQDGSGNLIGGAVFGQRTAVISLERVQISLTDDRTFAAGRMSVFGYSHT